jgi:hypothetical protein
MQKACLKGYLLQSAPKTAAVQENATQRKIARMRTVRDGDSDCDCDISVQLLQFKIGLDWIGLDTSTAPAGTGSILLRKDANAIVVVRWVILGSGLKLGVQLQRLGYRLSAI